MRFAVGLVMNYCCFSGELLRTMYTCVIVSWDAKCQATDEWVSRMTRNLIRGRDQPFYYVLTEDGNAGYVAEGYFIRNGGYLNSSKLINLNFLFQTIWNCILRVLSSTTQILVCTLKVLTVVATFPMPRREPSIQTTKRLRCH
jgi:hemimethylated DNA binding protein